MKNKIRDDKKVLNKAVKFMNKEKNEFIFENTIEELFNLDKFIKIFDKMDNKAILVSNNDYKEENDDFLYSEINLIKKDKIKFYKELLTPEFKKLQKINKYKKLGIDLIIKKELK